MKLLYLDCFSGIAGDMLLGALIDLGVDLGTIRRKLAALPLRGYELSARRVSRQGISGTKFDVRVGRGHAHRGWSEIRKIIEDAGFEDAVRVKSLAVFRRLIEVEARIHRVPVERVHLHEVGAVDAIVDIVGSVIALREVLGADGRLHASPLRLGSGTVTMEHGTFPVPAPATAALVKGVPVSAGPVEGELVTPTGAALVTTLAVSFGPLPPMTVREIGYGAGTREYADHPNLLRAILGESTVVKELREEVSVLECTVDDMNPQGYGYLMERLFAGGALEVFYTPVLMKKNRPGTLVTIIVPENRFGSVAAILFRESTTIGFRHTIAGRVELARDIVTVATPFGPVRMKISSLDGVTTQAHPEYEDCRKLASTRDVPLKEVQAAAVDAYRASRPAAARAARPATPRKRKAKR
ncbi:MAG: nickel pincer cofactor biosynthesis protein LarC [Acidobacteria bacterium]|nr:nickel pincer cofactor biosynthesis protein LarC [Acidobacteriota bacterium]